MSMESVYGPDSCIKVDGDEYPDIVTTILAERCGQPKLFTAYGERAGNNLVQETCDDPEYKVRNIRVVDYTNLSVSGIAGLMPHDEFVEGLH